ncbi:MAG: phosphonate C-P lyase system protein PhnL [Proteobacteria bacterium]|nr:phosphonate C-P lyase system protein PhnL [Pseudomonadota bacterium]
MTPANSGVALRVENLSKSFTLHAQGGISLPVLSRIDMAVQGGECVALVGPSGAGKSTLLKCIYANYLSDTGSIKMELNGETHDILNAAPRDIIRLRKESIGYVSQFLRVIPRISALEIVAGPLAPTDTPKDEALDRARTLLSRLNIPEHLWNLPPATFSGGEQQRVNIARGFAVHYPVLLLDEPTAALDRNNRDVVIELIREARDAGAALVGIFHDEEVRDAVADRLVTVQPLVEAA